MILFFIYCVDWNTANVYIKKLYIVIECLFDMNAYLFLLISCGNIYFLKRKQKFNYFSYTYIGIFTVNLLK